MISQHVRRRHHPGRQPRHRPRAQRSERDLHRPFPPAGPTPPAPVRTSAVTWTRGSLIGHEQPQMGMPHMGDGSCSAVQTKGRTGISRHQAHWPSADGQPSAPAPRLTTASVVYGCWEVRLVRIAPDAAGRWTLRIGGWAVAADEPPEQQEGPKPLIGLSADGLTSCVIALPRHHDHRSLHRPAGAHAFGPARWRCPTCAPPFRYYPASLCRSRRIVGGPGRLRRTAATYG